MIKQLIIFNLFVRSKVMSNTGMQSDRVKCIVRLINLVSGLVMIGFGIGGIIFMAANNILNGKFFLVFSPVFMILFGLMVIGSEFAFKSVTGYFGFLQSMIGRGIFNIYLSSTVFYYFSCGEGSIVWLGWTMASILFAVGVFYFVIYCCGAKGTPAQNKQQMM